ncbi:MAG: alpha-galactosidase, partial [Micromonosporaceae bacterium]|nr:alpha-galactosidase [Micromonosporaceae bacterium]
MTEISRRTFLQVTGATGVVAATGLGQASAAYSADPVAAADGGPASITVTDDTIHAANDVVRVALRFAAGSLNLTSLFNVAANTEYQTVPAGGQLFSYSLDGVATVAADDGGWTFGTPEISPIIMFTRQGERTVGRQVRLAMSRTAPRALTVTVVLEVYNGRAGVRFYTLIRNGSATDPLTITSSVVLALGFANLPHTLHYVPNAIWKSTRGALAPVPEDTSTPAKQAELPKKAISVYDAGHGWSFSPELNWKTLKGKGNVTTGFMLPPFASLDVWSGTDHVRLITNPSALQLVLFPNEEFEYLSVNVTVFVGGLVDGKMAEQEHFRARFRYNNIITLMHTNDFDYRAGPSRQLPPDYYYTTIIPKALAAGLDMVMLDDLWNTTRDSIEPSDAMNLSIHSLGEFSQTLTDRGLLFGLWFSLSGGGHVAGRDLADPAMLAFKRGQIETLITDFHMTHQMIDLTEYWQNEAVTEYSHPSDNVYRKAVLSRRLMNDLVAEHPHLLPKMTTELDIFPTQGDRNNGLMHVCNNGWNTANGGVTGESLSLRTALTGFGHLPMESAYMNGGIMSGRMEDYYSYLAVRTVKFPQDPGNAAQWPPAAIALMATFNAWRRSPRVRELTGELFRPVFFGPGWDTSAWDSSVGPYVWMFTDTGRTKALVLATGAGGQTSGAAVNLRWLDDTATYMIADITLDDSGGHSYAYRGASTGAALKSAGFPIDLRANTSRGKAFWVSRVLRPGAQVVYADENVGRWVSFVLQGVLNVVLTGTANSTATLVLADPG